MNIGKDRFITGTVRKMGTKPRAGQTSEGKSTKNQTQAGYHRRLFEKRYFFKSSAFETYMYFDDEFSAQRDRMFAAMRRDSPKILQKEVIRRDPLTHWVTILR